MLQTIITFLKKYNTSGSETLSVGSGGTRIAAAKSNQKIVSNTDLTLTNFGLMEWSTTIYDTRIR